MKLSLMLSVLALSLSAGALADEEMPMQDQMGEEMEAMPMKDQMEEEMEEETEE
ncbi:MAG TPA: hypothetical protein VIC51_15205 [Psychromonas sp.]